MVKDYQKLTRSVFVEENDHNTGFGMSKRGVEYVLFVNGEVESSDQVFNIISGF